MEGVGINWYGNHQVCSEISLFRKKIMHPYNNLIKFQSNKIPLINPILMKMPTHRLGNSGSQPTSFFVPLDGNVVFQKNSYDHARSI